MRFSGSDSFKSIRIGGIRLQADKSDVIFMFGPDRVCPHSKINMHETSFVIFRSSNLTWVFRRN